MVAAAADQDEGLGLERTCHLCGDIVKSDVWFARTEPREEGPTRVYACPDCYFSLTDEARETYFRERV